MASQLLSAAEAGPWREDKVAPSDRGISLHWLCNLVADLQAVLNEPREQAMREADSARSHNKAGRWGHHDMPDREIPEIPPYCFLNTHALVSQFVVPLTKEIGAPLFALVPPEHRGRPTTFISHTWNSLLVGPQQQRIGTLDAVYTEEDEFVWIDFACYNQNGVDNSKISEDMEGVVKTIDKLVVAVTPTPLYSRSWCLWELYCADIAGLTPEFRVHTGFRNDKIQAVNALYRSFSGVENAHSISARDEEQIRNAFISRHGGVEPANAAIKAMLERHLSSKWHELQPDEGPLKFSPGPWTADPDGATLRAYAPYWEPGLLDCLIYGSKQTVREVFASAGVYIGALEKTALSAQQSDPANRRLIAALQNEDVEAIMGVAYADGVDLNQPLPFRSVLSFVVAPPLHFLMPWAQRRTIEALLLVGADVNLPWAFLPETKSTEAAQRKALVDALLSGVGDPHQAEWTPLMLAVQRGDANICTWLIEHGASIRWPSPPPGVKSAFVNFRCPKTGLTALHLAADGKRSDLVQLLLQSGAAVDDALISGMTALHIAAVAGDVDSIKLLLKSGADQSLCDRTGRSAQEWAQECKHPEAAELLGMVVSPAAAAPATTPGTDVDFGTLMKAIRAGDVAAVQTAISRGIDPAKGFAPDSPTPFGFAVAEGSSNIVRLMLESGVNPNASVAGGSTTALSLAADKGRSEIVRMLLASGATVDAEERDGRTALVWAAERGNDDIVTALLDRGADVNHVVRSNGATALHAATQKEHEATVALLVARGARVDLATTGGNTALHFAAFSGNTKIVAILLAHSADPASANRKGKSARDVAREERKSDVLRLLEESFAAAPATTPKRTPEPSAVAPPVTPPATAPAPTTARALKTYVELRREFVDDWPIPSSTFLDDVLWALHRDPDPAASLKLSCDNPPFPVVDAIFEKKPDGIISTVHVQDGKNRQRPSETTVMHYTLVDGAWQSKAIERLSQRLKK